MSPIPIAVLHAREADSGKSLPGAFPLETDQAAGSQKAAKMDPPENQGKTAGTKAPGALPSRENKQPVEDHTWLKSLDALEAQPVENTEPLELGQTRYMKLSRRQLENYDDVDILDAMERGEW